MGALAVVPETPSLTGRSLVGGGGGGRRPFFDLVVGLGGAANEIFAGSAVNSGSGTRE